MSDTFSTTNLSKKRHENDPNRGKIVQFLKDRWITRKQFDKLSGKQLMFIGQYNRDNKHHPSPSVKNYDASTKRKDPHKNKKKKKNGK